MAALQKAYSGSDIKSNQNIAAVIAADTGTLLTLGSSVVMAQLGGKAIPVTVTVNAGTGASIACSPGNYSATGNTPCTASSAGSYVAGAGATAQTAASAGYYVNSVGATGQIVCTAGYFGSVSGNTASTCNGACTAGYYCGAGSTSATQTQCPANSYCPVGSGNPTTCAGGTSSPVGSINVAACVVSRSEQLYSSPGTYMWTVPAGITNVSVVTVGGGGAGTAYNGHWSGCGG
jgi:hypothetical protein